MFQILKIEILTIFFLFSLTWETIVVKISKRYSYKSQSKVSKLVLNIFLQLMVITKLAWGFFTFRVCNF